MNDKPNPPDAEMLTAEQIETFRDWCGRYSQGYAFLQYNVICDMALASLRAPEDGLVERLRRLSEHYTGCPIPHSIASLEREKWMEGVIGKMAKLIEEAAAALSGRAGDRDAVRYRYLRWADGSAVHPFIVSRQHGVVAAVHGDMADAQVDAAIEAATAPKDSQR